MTVKYFNKILKYIFLLSTLTNIKASIIFPSKQCNAGQVLDIPAIIFPQTNACQAFGTTGACCDPGTATRALTWALEDDGCGILEDKITTVIPSLTGLRSCQSFINDLICQVNCGQYNVMDGIPGDTTNNLRMVISALDAEQVYAACVNDVPWCASIPNAQLSSCTTLQTSSTRVSSGLYAFSSGYVTTTTLHDAMNTCSYTQDLTPTEFVTHILNMVIAPPGTNYTQITIQLRNDNNSANKYNFSFSILLVLILLSSFIIMFL